MTAGTTAARSGTFYTQVEVQVPIQFIANPISTFYADSNPESYWQRIYAIGNHTMNHVSGWKTKDAQYFRQIDECNKILGLENMVQMILSAKMCLPCHVMSGEPFL